MVQNVPEVLNNFYPDIYKKSTCQEIQAVIYLQNYSYAWFCEYLENSLRQWTLTENVDPAYVQKLFNVIPLPYIDFKCIQFAYYKKTPRQLIPSLVDTFELKKENLQMNIDFENAIFTLTYDTKQDDTEWNKFYPYISFLKSYIQQIIYPFFHVFIEIKYKRTMADYTETMEELSKKTILEIMKMV